MIAFLRATQRISFNQSLDTFRCCGCVQFSLQAQIRSSTSSASRATANFVSASATVATQSPTNDSFSGALRENASRFWQKFFPKPTSRYKQAGYDLYFNCSNVDYLKCIQTFNLPDTIQSWVRITGLQIWFCLVRLNNIVDNDDNYELIKETLLNSFWKDLRDRLTQVGLIHSLNRKTMLEDYFSFMTTYWKEWEEGILGDDRELSSALWRTFYEHRSFAAVDITSLGYFERRRFLKSNAPRYSRIELNLTEMADVLRDVTRLTKYVREETRRFAEYDLEDFLSNRVKFGVK